jgi:hypothetical protein
VVAHICNPSYSGGRDRNDHDLRPAQANSKNPSQSIGRCSAAHLSSQLFGRLRSGGSQVPSQHGQKVPKAPSQQKKLGKEGREGGRKEGREGGREVGRKGGREEGR